MSNTENHTTTAFEAFDPFLDPVAYLAELGIVAELVAVEWYTLEEAA